VPENLKKASLYFRSTRAYWSLQDHEQRLAINAGPMGRYPLNLESLLGGAHFTDFDQAGLPVRKSSEAREFLHNYSTLCAWGLGHWDRYLRTGNGEELRKLLLVADYILQTCHHDGNVALLRAERPAAGHTGEVSALWQANSISVLCRAWHATQTADYLETACLLVPLFDVPVEEGGVLGYITRLGVHWYEEYVQKPLNHVLNGMLYALVGLRDLILTTAHPRATELFQQGIASVIAALPEFDTGYWSWYQLSETGSSYIASMGYHTLHVRLLEALSERTGQPELGKWAARFQSYAHSPLNRCHALMQIVQQKVRPRPKPLSK
jgi:heparosan-N-sulfate-glucuronate 5-epimerase